MDMKRGFEEDNQDNITTAAYGTLTSASEQTFRHSSSQHHYHHSVSSAGENSALRKKSKSEDDTSSNNADPQQQQQQHEQQQLQQQHYGQQMQQYYPQFYLPPGWSTHHDPNTNRSYFVNTATGHSQWEPPTFQQYPPSAVPYYQPYTPQIDPQQRTIYFGNVPSCPIEEILNVVRGGLIERATVLPEKKCAFITFVDAAAANNFYADSLRRRLIIAGSRDIKVGWGKGSQISQITLSQVQSGATRAIYIGNVDDQITIPFLASQFAAFGPIDQIKIVPEKKIAFVHMCSIQDAVTAVTTLPSSPLWSTRRINYGKDRCARIVKQHVAGDVGSMNGHQHNNSQQQHHQQQQQQLPYQQRPVARHTYNNDEGKNRTIYLGSLPPDISTKDLCDNIVGGAIQSIRLIKDKGIAFVNFVDPTGSNNFHTISQSKGFVVAGKHVKVGWGKGNPISSDLVDMVSRGCTRCIELSNIDHTLDAVSLRNEFDEFGPLESIRVDTATRKAYVNYDDMASAVRAFEKTHSSPLYTGIEVTFGKDRCDFFQQ